MTDAQLCNRLERLERENRMMKRAGLTLVAVALAVALIGAAAPQTIPEVIEARMFRVIDENGQTRAAMTAAGIGYQDENGTIRSLMGADGFSYRDENSKLRAEMTADGTSYWDDIAREDPILAIIPRASMGADGSFYYDNENRILRAAMGAAGFAYYDEKGTTRSLMTADGFPTATRTARSALSLEC